MASSRALARILYLVNPGSGGGEGARLFKHLKQYVSEYRAQDMVLSLVDLQESFDLGQAIRSASLVVVAGGDGTISSLAAEYFVEGTLFAVLPLGTGNDLAKELGVSKPSYHRMNEYLDWLASANEISLPVWEACWGVGDNERQRFINYFSIGFDAAVVKRFAELRGRLRGKQTRLKNRVLYIRAALECFFEPGLPEVEIVSNGSASDRRAIRTQSRALFLTNISSVMGLGRFAPSRLAMTESLYCFRFTTPMGYLRPIAYRFLRVLRMNEVMKSSEFLIKGPLQDVPVQYDGEEMPVISTNELTISQVGHCRLLAKT